MATPENRVKARVRDILDMNGVYFFSPFGAGAGRAGIPDIIGCVNGFFLAIECKAGKGRTTALQDRELGRIRLAGGVALVVYDTDDDMRTLHAQVQLLRMRNGIQGIPYDT